MEEVEFADNQFPVVNEYENDLDKYCQKPVKPIFDIIPKDKIETVLTILDNLSLTEGKVLKFELELLKSQVYRMTDGEIAAKFMELVFQFKKS